MMMKCPRCLNPTGTTWAQEIMSAVLHDGDLAELNKQHTFKRVAFLETTPGGTVLKKVGH